MDPIYEIRAKLSGHSGVNLNEEKKYIEAVPSTENSFSVSLINEGFQFTVTYGGGWHEHFSSAHEALNCFGFGLSERCRLKTHFAGNSEYKWTAEYNEDGAWLEISTTGLIFFPVWQPRQIVYLQNRVTTKEPGNDWQVL